MGKIFKNIYLFLEKRKITFFVAMVLLLIIAGYYSFQIRFEEDISKMMPSDNELKEINETLEDIKFLDKMVIRISFEESISNPDPNKLIDYAEKMNYLLELKLKPEFIDSINLKMPDNLFTETYQTFYDNLPIFLDSSDYDKILQSIEPENIKSKIDNNYNTLMSPAGILMKKFLLDDPLSIASTALKRMEVLKLDDNINLYNGYLITNDKRNIIFFIFPSHPSSETNQNAKMLDKMDSIIHQIKKPGDNISIDYFGTAAIAVGNAEQIKSDIILTITIALISILIIIIYFYRKIVFIPIVTIPFIFGSVITIALLYFFKGNISAISLGIGSILLGESVDFAIYILTLYRNNPKNMGKVIEDVSMPIIMGCLTTSAAFICLLFMSSEALGDLGLFASMSISIAALFALIILPLLLKHIYKDNYVPVGNTIFDKIGTLRPDTNKYIVIALLVLTIIFAFFSNKVEFDTDINNMNFLTNKLKKSQDKLSEITSVTNKTIMMVSKAETIDSAITKSFKLDQKLVKLKEKGIISNFSSISLLIPNKKEIEIRVKRWKEFWNYNRIQKLQNDLKNASASYGFKDNSFNSFFRLISNDYHFSSYDQLAEKLNLYSSGMITNVGNNCLLTTNIKIQPRKVKDFYSSIRTKSSVDSSGDYIFLDKSYLTNKFIEIIKKDFDKLLLISILAVFMILLIVFGRIELAVITIIPVLLSWIWTLGIMGLFGIKFTIFNIVITTLSFGMGIDYTIFIVKGLLQEYQYGSNSLISFKSSILLSSLTTLSGMGALLFAEHPALKSISVLAIIGISSVLLLSYTITPVIFRLLIPLKEKKRLPLTLLTIIFSFIAYTLFLTGSFTLTAITFVLLTLPIKRKSIKIFFHVLIHWSACVVVYGMFNVKKNMINREELDNGNPCVIISNHHSVIDILYFLSLSPKIILVTNDWVWNSPVFGKVVQFADFFPVTSGIENSLEKLSKKVKEGFSIVVFPEGSRSKDGTIQRFHKGAFYIAEKLNLDILPVVLHGLNDRIKKGEFTLSTGMITMKFLKRIKPNDISFGETYSTRTKSISKLIKVEYNKLKLINERSDYHNNQLIKNYIYKGPILEWYLRTKLKLENNYQIYQENLPLKGKIYDIGCGYGFISYHLSFYSKERKIIGIDYDDKKIATAENCISKNPDIQFVCADVSEYEYQSADAFLISDVLHYLSPEKQDILLNKCISNLNDGGILLIRDSDSDYIKRSKGTWLSELFSTKLGFNKTNNCLNFISGMDLISKMANMGFECQIIDNSKFTANMFYIFRRTG